MNFLKSQLLFWLTPVLTAVLLTTDGMWQNASYWALWFVGVAGLIALIVVMLLLCFAGAAIWLGQELSKKRTEWKPGDLSHSWFRSLIRVAIPAALAAFGYFGLATVYATSFLLSFVMVALFKGVHTMVQKHNAKFD